MFRALFLIVCVASVTSDTDGEIASILQKLNSNANAEKVYNRADLIYAEFKASESRSIDVDWGLFF